jgi:hypothetical protein
MEGAARGTSAHVEVVVPGAADDHGVGVDHRRVGDDRNERPERATLGEGEALEEVEGRGIGEDETSRARSTSSSRAEGERASTEAGTQLLAILGDSVERLSVLAQRA